MKINNIATRANQINRVSKKQDAIELLDEIIEGLTIQSTNPEVTEKLVKLYSFFMPPTPPTKADGFDWVKQCCTKGSVRGFTDNVTVRDNMVITSDGAMLMMSEQTNTDLSDGQYIIKGERIDFDDLVQEMPNLTGVIPDETKGDVEWFNLSELEVEARGAFHVVIINGVAIDRKKLLMVIGKEKNFRACVRGDDQAVKVWPESITGERFAVIMPVRR